MEEDPLKKLLLQTGWSYSEVLKKLEAYKNFDSSSESQNKTDSEKEQKEEDEKTKPDQEQKNCSGIDEENSLGKLLTDEKNQEECGATLHDSQTKQNISNDDKQNELQNGEKKEDISDKIISDQENQLENSILQVQSPQESEDKEQNGLKKLGNAQEHDSIGVSVEENKNCFDDDLQKSQLLTAETCDVQENRNKETEFDTTQKECLESDVSDTKTEKEYEKVELSITKNKESLILNSKLESQNEQDKVIDLNEDDSYIKVLRCSEKDQEQLESCTENKSAVNYIEVLDLNEDNSSLEVSKCSEKDQEQLENCTENKSAVNNIESEDSEEIITEDEDDKLDNTSSRETSPVIENHNYLQMNETGSEDVILEVRVKSYSDEVNTRHLNNVKRRIMRKYKNMSCNKNKRKCDNKLRIIQKEDIHTKLKEQLELLRTKRKTTNLTSPISAFSSHSTMRLNSITSNLLQKLSNNASTSSHNKENEEIKCDNSQHEEGEDESEVLLSNETNLRICNVIGGYRSPSPEKNNDKELFNNRNEKQEESVFISDNESVRNEDEIKEKSANVDDVNKSPIVNENDSDSITPTKTTDVTKIKGWKKKKFLLNKKNSNVSSNNSVSPLSDSEASNQSKPSVLDKESFGDESDSSLDTNNQIQSAFVSYELDQYLTENSQLKISYEVPKLKAAQGCKQTYIDIKFPTPPENTTKPPVGKEKSVYKPKTLAEKRKMLAEANKSEIGNFMVNMNPRQRRTCESSVLRMRDQLIKKDVSFTRRCFTASTAITNTFVYVMYNGKKIRVPSPSSKRILMAINERKKYRTTDLDGHTRHRSLGLSRQRKPSLLDCLKTDKEKVMYDPTVWETVKLKLPKLTLEVIPEIGKSVHPKVEYLIQSNNTILSAQRVEFALSALKTTQDAPAKKAFCFPLVYKHNQTHIDVIKKRKVIEQPTAKPVNETDSEIDLAVRNVMDGMLNYVDIVEDTKDICKDPEVLNSSSVSPQIHTSNSRKRKERISDVKSVRKTTLEMKRLNCKIVSISLDDEENTSQSCDKESCQLGCICKSIECNPVNLLNGHCGLPGCMFECSCNNTDKDITNISLPAGADLFSERVINKLEDEVKKNLARVEKEFTQTVIKTNNQIIIVGDTKERKRRTIKTPKKFNDFVEDPEDVISQKSEAVVEIDPSPVLPLKQENDVNNIIVKSKHNFKPCSVSLIKYNFNDIIPFCMIHNLYKCHCKNTFVGPTQNENIVACKFLSPVKPTAGKNVLKSKKGKGFNKELFSSRTRGLPTSYYLIRNKSASYRCQIMKSSKRLQKELEAYLRKNAANILQEIETQLEIPLDDIDTLEKKPCEIPVSELKPKHKRKQSLIVLEDPGTDSLSSKPGDCRPELLKIGANDKERELKLQRRKVKPNLKFANGAKDDSPSTHSSGDLRKSKNEFLALINKKNSHFRLLPWTELSGKFQSGSFQFWHSNSVKTCPITITENGRRPTTHHYNIKLFKHMTRDSAIPSDIIRCLINNKVPLDKSPDSILVVLTSNKSGNWEICGLCEKTKSNDDTSKDKLTVSLIENWNGIEENVELSAEDEMPIINLEDENCTEDKSEKPKDSQKDVDTKPPQNIPAVRNLMYCNKRQFQIKKLISEETEDDTLKVRQVVWAPVPIISSQCQWRVINLSVGFSYLSLTRCNYTIRYEDILKAVSLANTNKITVVLKSQELLKHYKHRQFGIYCVHNYSDKIFVGPYSLKENPDLDTYSLINNVIVNTNLFNQIQGKSVPDSGHWFRQAEGSYDIQRSVDDDVILVQDKPAVVDLTLDSGDENDESNDNILFNRDLKISPKSAELEKETKKAEKTLDHLLKIGKLNVNQPLVQLESSSQKLSRSNSTSDSVSVDDSDDDQLVIDEPQLNTQDSSLLLNGEKLWSKTALLKTFACVDNYVKNDACLKYLVTNVPHVGYILAYQHEGTKLIDVSCPITKRIKRFTDAEVAVSSLQRVLSKRFIMVPSSFKLEVKLLDNPDKKNSFPLDRLLLNGFHAVGTYGVLHVQYISSESLKHMNFKKTEIDYILQERDKKTFWNPVYQLAKLLNVPVNDADREESLKDILSRALMEIDILRWNDAAYIKEKIDLETVKVSLVEKCTKLQSGLPSPQQVKAQQELDQIVTFNKRSDTVNNKTINKTTTSDANLDSSKVTALISNSSSTSSVTASEFKKTDNESLLPKQKAISLSHPDSSKIRLNKVLLPIPVTKKNLKSLLTGQIKSFTTPTISKVIEQKQSTSTSTNVVDSTSMRGCQKSYVKTEEKLLIKGFPMKISKEMIELVNQKHKMTTINSSTSHSAKTTATSNSIKTSVSNSTLSNIISKKNSPATQTSRVNNAIVVPKQSLIPISAANVVSSSNKPLTCISTYTLPTTTPEMCKTSMATLTCISKTKSVPKTVFLKNRNYLAVPDGENVKYYFVGSKTPVQSVQAIKRPATSSVIQPPAKKAASSILKSNQTQKTDK